MGRFIVVVILRVHQPVMAAQVVAQAMVTEEVAVVAVAEAAEAVLVINLFIQKECWRFTCTFFHLTSIQHEFVDTNQV